MFLFYMAGLHLDTIIQRQQTKRALNNIISLPQECRSVACKLDLPTESVIISKINLFIKNVDAFVKKILGSQISINPIVLYMGKAYI